MKSTNMMKSPTTDDTNGSTPESALFRVEGVVQGVGYRWWAKSRADELGVRGSVRNLSDGAVEVLAVAAPAAVTRFRALLKEGPPAAVVARVLESHPSEADSHPTSFTISR